MRYDVAVVGAGIIGLGHALAAARRGRSVVVLERDRLAQGASVRNFGMVWPIGQPAELHATALRSRAIWLEAAAGAGLWAAECGSLHLLRERDELAVGEEFAARAPGLGVACELLTPAQTVQRCPAVRADGLLGAVWSPSELCVDPRQALAALPAYLAAKHGVEFRFGTAVVAAEPGRAVTATGDTVAADRIVVCTGADFAVLFPAAYAAAGVRRCKLQMLATGPQPDGWRLGPHVAGGLTLGHYAAFRVCPSLPALKRRFELHLPEHVRLGVHVMAAQNHLGEVVIGDSHEYDDDITPFDRPAIDELILTYLRRLLDLPDWVVARRWHGLYAKGPEPVVRAEPLPGVAVMVSPGGGGMTLAFGLADEWWARQSA